MTCNMGASSRRLLYLLEESMTITEAVTTCIKRRCGYTQVIVIRREASRSRLCVHDSFHTEAFVYSVSSIAPRPRLSKRQRLLLQISQIPRLRQI